MDITKLVITINHNNNDGWISLYGIVISNNLLSFMVWLLETTSNRLSFMVRLWNVALEMVQFLEFLQGGAPQL